MEKQLTDLGKFIDIFAKSTLSFSKEKFTMNDGSFYWKVFVDGIEFQFTPTGDFKQLFK